MTKQTKYILFGALGLAIAGGALVLFIAATAIGISIMAAESDDAEPKNKPSVSRTSNSRERQKKSVDDSNETKENPGDEAANLKGSLDPELVGKWVWSEGSRQIDNTGKTQYGGGSWHTYEFTADGAVEYTMKKDLLTIMQCRINESKSGRGTAVSDGETLTISFGEMQDTGTSSCGGEDNFDKTIPAETVKLKYELKTEYGETSLCLAGSDGEACYQKEK